MNTVPESAVHVFVLFWAGTTGWAMLMAWLLVRSQAESRRLRTRLRTVDPEFLRREESLVQRRLKSLLQWLRRRSPNRRLRQPDDPASSRQSNCP